MRKEQSLSGANSRVQHQILWLYLVIQTWLLRGAQTPGAASPPGRHSPPDGKGAAAGTLRHGLARTRAGRHRPPELTGARPPESNRDLERPEKRAKSPSASRASGRPTSPSQREQATRPSQPGPRGERGEGSAVQEAVPPTPSAPAGTFPACRLRGAAYPARPTNPQQPEGKRVPAPKERAPPPRSHLSNLFSLRLRLCLRPGTQVRTSDAPPPSGRQGKSRLWAGRGGGAARRKGASSGSGR